MAKKKASRKSIAKKRVTVQVDSLRHKDTRKNIPTEELRDFVREEDQRAAPVLYPRDPSLDPQLVWKGKDEQDAEPLSVPTVPIYIQEKIHPHHIIEDFRRSLPLPRGEGRGEGTAERQLELFSDFNGRWHRGVAVGTVIGSVA